MEYPIDAAAVNNDARSANDSIESDVFRILTEQSADLLFAVTAADNRFFYINQNVTEILGFSVAEAMAISPQSMLTAASTGELCAAIHRAIAGNTAGLRRVDVPPQHLQLLAKNRRRIAAEVRLTLTLHDDQSVGVITGVVKSDAVWLKTREHARRSEERYHGLFDNMRSGCAVCEPVEDCSDFIVRDFNCAAERMEKVKRQAVLGRSVREAFSGIGHSGLFPVLQAVARTGKPRMHQTSQCNDGHVTGWREHFIYRLPSGEIVVLSEDATARKQHEAALEASEQRHRTLLNGIPDAILRINADGTVDYCKPDAGNLLITTSEVAGYDLFSLPLGEEKSTRLRAHLRRILDGETLPPDEIELPVHGSRRTVEIRMFRETGRTAILFIRDITDKRRTETELIKTQRLESLGLLAGGIAHDFNNLLGLIFGQIDMALEELDPFGEPARRLQNSIRAFERARDLTGQLITLSKEKVPVKRQVGITGLVRDAATLAFSGSNIAYSIHAPDVEPVIEADPGQMSQVINNLLINARQAMEHGGTIAIEIREAAPGELSKAAFPGRCIVVQIDDEGCGIPPDKLHAIFDPFYTTKENGSGLGLAVVYSIITRHGGTISVESTPGRGTRFTLLLPVGAVGSRGAPPPAVETRPRSLHGKILIMDDEEVLLDIATQMCRRLGLETDSAGHGAAVIELYRDAFREGHPYDAVLLDMTIAGGTGGLEAAEHIRKIDPEAKCIVMTGYSDHEVMADPKKYGFCAVISKPFRLNEFGKALGEVLQLT